MKKFLMIAVMAVAALTASAQKGEYYVTPHLNLGYGMMSNMDDVDDAVLGGLGVDLEYMLADKFGVSAGLDFNYGESGEVKVAFGDSWEEGHNSYGWLNIPVLAQYHFGSFAVKAGLQPSFLLAADYHCEGSDERHHYTEDESIKDAFNSFGLSLPIGLSYSFKVPVTLDLRCAIPLTNQLKEDYIDGKNSKLTTITLSVGYRF